MGPVLMRLKCDKKNNEPHIRLSHVTYVDFVNTMTICGGISVTLTCLSLPTQAEEIVLA